MKIVKGMDKIFAIKEGQRKINQRSNPWSFNELKTIMNKKVSKEDHTQMTAIFNDIYHKVNETGIKWEAMTVAKDNNGDIYWFTHRKNKNIPELMYYHNATKVMTWKNKDIA